jgi:2-polyprenyl-3-methyl-5-hydroxy-6-metoxy-1,4-benzoquinol methylase
LAAKPLFTKGTLSAQEVFSHWQLMGHELSRKTLDFNPPCLYTQISWVFPCLAEAIRAIPQILPSVANPRSSEVSSLFRFLLHQVRIAMSQNVCIQPQLAVPSLDLPDERRLAGILTERQQRERDYYEEFSRLNPPVEVCFAPVLGTERRPWNPYWFLCESVAGCFRSPGQRLLDFGCGPGIYSTIFGKAGYEVIGFDISPNNIAIARQLAERYGLSETVHFTADVAEDVKFPNDYFDVVVGIDILHHVDIAHSVKECMRVLKPGGAAFFKEPVEAAVFERLRNSAFGRWLLPKNKSLERHITEDERKLTSHDLQTIAALCSEMSVKRFRLFSRLDAFNKNLATNGRPSPIEKFDERVFQLLPFMQALGGDVVICLKKA